jgi:hypothetical protein
METNEHNVTKNDTIFIQLWTQTKVKLQSNVRCRSVVHPSISQMKKQHDILSNYLKYQS